MKGRFKIFLPILIKFFKKQGKKEKSYSLTESFDKGSGDILVMIDADLQYPIEAMIKVNDALKRQMEKRKKLR